MPHETETRQRRREMRERVTTVRLDRVQNAMHAVAAKHEISGVDIQRTRGHSDEQIVFLEWEKSGITRKVSGSVAGTDEHWTVLRASAWYDDQATNTRHFHTTPNERVVMLYFGYQESVDSWVDRLYQDASGWSQSDLTQTETLSDIPRS